MERHFSIEPRMGNMCFSGKHRKIQRKFSEEAILRPCKAHSANSEDVRDKRITLLGGPTFDSHFTCLAALIEAGADVNETLDPGPTGHTPLHYHPLQHKLSFKNKVPDVHFQCIKLLVDKGADVNIHDQNGRLSLHNAAKANHVNCVELFIKSGADVNAQDNNGKTPLFAAAENGRYECIEKLLQLGADVNSQDEEKCRALFTVVKKGYHKCLKLMIQFGADVNIRGNRDGTALMEAAVEKDHKGIHILIDSGADVNCVTDTGLTSLMFAAWCDSWHESTLCVKRLLRSGAHVNKINKFGQNALQISVASNTTFCYKKDDYGDHYGKDVIMLLLAAGECIKGTTVDRINYSGYYNYTQNVPKYLQDFNKIKLSLKWACGEVIRKRLIQCDPHTNLFINVPKLGLPKPLHPYLLYNMSVECKETLYHVK